MCGKMMKRMRVGKETMSLRDLFWMQSNQLVEIANLGKEHLYEMFSCGCDICSTNLLFVKLFLILVRFMTDGPVICRVAAKDTETVSELQRGRSGVFPVAAADCGDRDG